MPKSNPPGLAAVLERVHFPELTTIYPPVSQAVFAVADLVTPTSASLRVRVVWMKLWIVLCDLLVVVLLSGLLASLNKHQAWLILYAWSPLAIKEFANSGHLDSIAVMFSTAAFVGLVRLVLASSHWIRQDSDNASRNPKQPLRSKDLARPKELAQRLQTRWIVFTAVSLAFGVGAKLYPIIWLPLFVCSIGRFVGWRAASGFLALHSFIVMLVLTPMFWDWGVEGNSATQTIAAGEMKQVEVDPLEQLGQSSFAPPIPSSTGSVADPGFQFDLGGTTVMDFDVAAPSFAEPSVEQRNFARDEAQNDDGLVEFLSRWEMNDLIFMTIEENLRPEFGPRGRPWFVVLSDSQRDGLARWFGSLLGMESRLVPFPATRLLTLAIFAVVAAGLLWGAPQRSDDSNRAASLLLESGFLMVAWFWLLAPTQNSWYWTWALPLVPFARNRIWVAMGCLPLVYYLRFWFSYQYSESNILGWGYVGTDFFDFVVVWFEFAPWFLLLFLFWLWRVRFRDRRVGDRFPRDAAEVETVRLEADGD